MSPYVPYALPLVDRGTLRPRHSREATGTDTLVVSSSTVSAHARITRNPQRLDRYVPHAAQMAKLSEREIT